MQSGYNGSYYEIAITLMSLKRGDFQRDRRYYKNWGTEAGAITLPPNAKRQLILQNPAREVRDNAI